MSGFLGALPLIGSIADIGGGIAQGILGRKATGAAAGQVEAADVAAQNTIRQQLAQTQQQEQPWITAGTNALPMLQQLLGIGPGSAGATNPVLQMLGIGPGGSIAPGGPQINASAFENYPGFKFAQQEGMNAILGGSGRTGLSSNTLQGLSNFGTGLAQQDFGQYLNALNTGYNNLVSNVGGVSGTGLGAVQNLGSLGASAANTIAGLQGQYGTTQAAGTIGQANQVGNIISSLIGGLGTPGQYSTQAGQNTGGTGLFGALSNYLNMGAPAQAWQPWSVNPGGGMSYTAGPTA